MDEWSWFTLVFFNDPAATEIYTLSLHDALPIAAPRVQRGDRCVAAEGEGDPGISQVGERVGGQRPVDPEPLGVHPGVPSPGDRKSTRLNSSHANISYAVFCLKKKQ